MDIREVAMQLWPCWVLGVFVIYQVWKSEHREILKVDFKALGTFLKWMLFITAVRFIGLKLVAPDGMVEDARQLVNFLPWQTTLGVFWEDAVYTMPLFLLGKIHAGKKWYERLKIPLLIVAMISFGAGHVYQGGIAAIALSLYLPWSMGMAKRYGYGTVMAGHVLYDMITLLSLKVMLGA